ncbi:MAG TPA: hypothetical protein VEW47_16165 [Candidatus Dormibacteraeota bacterium]|nr:hypothetical protein [Candidatus Dormibacteraeota bacterium]
MRRWLLWVIAIVPTLSFGAASPPFEFLGKFSNMTYSQEHQDGEDVYLWREKNDLYGYMEYSLGAATMKLSFQARNPLYDEKGTVIRNLFVFDGLMRANVIEGSLKCRNATTHEPCLNDQTVSWKKVTLKNAAIYSMGSRRDWEAHINEQLEEHGARW